MIAECDFELSSCLLSVSAGGAVDGVCGLERAHEPANKRIHVEVRMFDTWIHLYMHPLMCGEYHFTGVIWDGHMCGVLYAI